MYRELTEGYAAVDESEDLVDSPLKFLHGVTISAPILDTDD